jgi:hypothetical protein
MFSFRQPTARVGQHGVVGRIGDNCPMVDHLDPRDCFFGGLAQLGEQLLCMQQVSGSSPLASTNLDLLGNLGILRH